MFIKFILNTFGFLLAYTPRVIPKAFSWLIGSLIYYLPSERRRMLLSNIQRAFPEKPRAWKRKVAKDSSKCFIEMILLLLAAPFLPKWRIRKLFDLSPELIKNYERRENNPILILPSHFALIEASIFIPLLFPKNKKCVTIGTIYRAFSEPAVEEYIKKARGRFGIELFSRKTEIGKAIQHIKSNEALSILFDQNSGPRGSLTLLFGRYASTTELPDIVAKKYNPKIYMMYPKRRGFWKATICIDAIEPVDYTDPRQNLMFKANSWLEEKLKSDHTLCSTWLWVHDRWKHQNHHQERFHINTKRDLIEDNLHHLGEKEVPKKSLYWFRLPNWLGDVVMTLPFLKAIRKARPDASITVIVQPHLIDLLKELDVADNYIPIPSKKSLVSYLLYFWKLRPHCPDMQLMFTNSFRGDLEAFLVGATQRFGIQRANKSKRSLITHPYNLPANVDENEIHQVTLWKGFLGYHGLKENLDFTPFKLPFAQKSNKIALICGTENSPEKRWPINKWVEFINLLTNTFPELDILLLGTKKDRLITQEILNSIKENPKVQNLAGETNLVDFSKYLSTSFCVICNDTGGMHLANALGTPVIALFGPTNLKRTGPIFDSKKIIVKPLDNSSNMSSIETTQVMDAFTQLYSNNNKIPTEHESK